MKKTGYIFLTAFLGLVLSFIVHGLIEIIYLNWASKNQIGIKWTKVVGGELCALPPWLIYLLPILGALFGVWLGFYWWRKVYEK